MQRLTWYGVALHAGHVPPYPASHGCVRMPFAFARWLFDEPTMGMTVVITESGRSIGVNASADTTNDESDASRGGGGFRSGGMRGGSFRGGSRDIRGSSVSNINRNGNADRAFNGNRGDRIQNPIATGGAGFQRGWDNVDRPHVEHPIAGVGRVDHPLAAGAVIGAAVATAAAVGSVWNYLPADCGSMYVNTRWYYQCGTAWYQPQYEGDDVQYEVVEDPR